MISSLRGTVNHVSQSSLVLDVHGVGYLVHVPARSLQGVRHGQETQLFTSLVVREDSMTLFGFVTGAERDIFETLTSVSGVGPKIGLAVLNTLTVEQIREAIANSDDKAFSSVSGIGPKGARRIVLELAGKLVIAEDAAGAGSASSQPQVLEALMGLGWSEKDAAATLKELAKAEPELVRSGQNAAILKAALQLMGSARA